MIQDVNRFCNVERRSVRQMVRTGGWAGWGIEKSDCRRRRSVKRQKEEKQGEETSFLGTCTIEVY